MESSRDCVEIFASLSQEELNALNAIAASKIGTVSITQLGKLKSLDLIHDVGRGIALTADGLAVLGFR